jgi:perosamine synthetase
MNSDIKNKIQNISIPLSGTIRDAMQVIDRGALGVALLVDPGTHEFKGLITDGDIRRALLKGNGLESPVRQISRPNPTVAHIGNTSEDISKLFSDPVRVIPLLNDSNQVEDLALFDRRMYLPVAEPFLGDQEIRYVTECIVTGWVSSSGKFVTQFEEMFANFCNTQYAVSTSNGTTALHLALLALGIGGGDEVIVPSLTFIATANAVTYTGARPVFVDSEEKTWNIDPQLIEDAITSRTKAIIPVHLYGHPADMDPIIEISARYNLKIIEDAAEAHGAQYKGQNVGGIGTIGIFSFYGNKIVTTGEGGMVVTNQPEIADKIRLLRDHGMSKSRRYWHTMLGYNYRLTNIQAALGVAQLEKIDSIIDKKITIANNYTEQLKNVPGIILPPRKDWAKNVYWMYSILVDEDKFGMDRDALIKILEREEIETRPFFPPIHTQPIYNTGQQLPVSEWLSKRGMNLPSAVTIRPQQIERVCKIIRESAFTSENN